MTRAAAIMCCCLLVSTATRVSADEAESETSPASDWRLAIGPVAGAVMFDRSLDNYRWDIGPTLQTGLQATLYRGRFGAGVRLLRAQTTQASGIPGEAQVPHVNATGLDIVGELRVVRYRGAELWGSAHAGRLHLGYDPDQLTFDTGGVGGPVTVAYDPISEWELGLGLEVRGELTRHMALSLQAEQSSFALDTAYRSGAAIVQTRERFYNWSLRLQVAWLIRLG